MWPYAFVVAGVLGLGLYLVLREYLRMRLMQASSATDILGRYDLEEATEWVAHRVALATDDVRRVLAWSIEYLRASVISGNGHGPEAPGLLVAGGPQIVAYILVQARDAGLDVEAEQVHAIVDAHATYLRTLGA